MPLLNAWKRAKFRLLVALAMLVTLLTLPVRAEITVSGGFTGQSLGPYWQVWEDPGLRRDVNSLPPKEQWQTLNEQVPGLGFSDSAFWFRTKITSSLLWPQTVYLHISNPLLTEIDVYWHPKGAAPRGYQTGSHFPFSSRVIPHRHYLFPLDLPARGSGEILLRVRSQSSVQVPAALVMPGELISAQEKEITWLGIAVGVPAIMMCYNLLLFVIVRERSYLYYALHVLGSLSFLLVWQGYAAQYVFPDSREWREHELALTALLATFFSNMFAEHYLGLVRRRFVLLPLYRTIRVLSASMLLMLWFLPEGVSNVLAMLLAAASAACISVAVVMGFSSGGRAVRVFCGAWLILISGVVLVALDKMGFLNINGVADQVLLAGFAVETLMIAFALADRLNSERYLKMHAQETALHHAEREKLARTRALNEEREAMRTLNEAVELQRNQQMSLEQQVAERTQALEDAHQRLLLLYEEDPLTGLKNRRYFSERLLEECKRARHLKQPMAILLIDVDYFKKINDTWGHLKGDQCIQHIARLLMAAFNRAGDCVARYGGEEFAVLMAQSDLATAQWVAENLRQKVEQMPAVLNGQTLPVTVSIGLAVFLPDEKNDVDHYLQIADEALYRAKSAGRNRVCQTLAGVPDLPPT